MMTILQTTGREEKIRCHTMDLNFYITPFADLHQQQ